ncbi:MAG: hypothetical protein WAL56_20650 [Candidatus Sulfotelmatobacter sp.]
MNDNNPYPSQLTYAAGQTEPRTLPAIAQPSPAAIRSLRQEIFYRARYFVNAYPALYMPWARYHHRYSMDRIVRPDTDLVIEAFGRTGTTFANFAFLSAQRRRVRTVHHTHAAAQIITAVRMNIPTLVIVREPEAVALSHMARHRVSARPALLAWIRFHQRLVSYRQGIVFCGFDQMTGNFTPVIERLNEKFGTCFDVWRHTPESEAEIFEQIKSRNRGRFREDQAEQRMRAFALPTVERENYKNQLRAHLDGPSLAAFRHRAHILYRALVG